MKVLIASVLVIATSICVAPVRADSFADEGDCTDVVSSAQIDACSKQEVLYSMQLLADELASLELRVVRAYVADRTLGGELVELVREAQNAWVSFRDGTCRLEAFELEPEAPAYATTVNRCVARMNAERVEVLRGIIR
ncbi:MAG: lysozyme inhibitor LprI family protein [Rhodocyclaceae bacterium]